jgi:uncharacterized membrane protein
MQWLRKAVLRASGLKALHDEDAIYAETVAELNALPKGPKRDHAAFVMAFKGVFLEGLEVVITVLTLGTSAHRLGLAITVAVIAVLLVAIVGIIVARQLSTVPENVMKMSVGIMLVSYGSFWVGEGLHVRWPGGDVSLLGFVGLYCVVALMMVQWLKQTSPGTHVRNSDA